MRICDTVFKDRELDQVKLGKNINTEEDTRGFQFRDCKGVEKAIGRERTAGWHPK